MENVSVEKSINGEKEWLKIIPKYSDMIVNYQLLMITGNKIPGFLEVKRTQNNDEIALLYDISGKKSLKSVLEERKLKKSEVLRMLDTIVKAESIGREYQLANKGIVIDPKYIYLSEKDAKTELLYIPFFDEDTDADALGKMLKDMIMDGSIENSNDGFVSALIDVLNKDGFSYGMLNDFLKKTERSAYSARKPKQVQHELQSPPRENREIYREKITSQPKSEPSNVPSTVTSPREPESNPLETKQPIKKKSGSSPKNIIFILAAGAVVILIGLLYTKGVFFENGSLKPEYMGAAILVGGAGLFILYREMFVNNKKKDAAVNDSGNDSKPLNKKPNPFVKGTSPTAVKPEKPVNAPPAKPRIKTKQTIPEKPEAPVKKYSQASPEGAAYRSGDKRSDYSDADYRGDGDTVILDENGSAYLEYAENGISMKFYIKGRSILVGKQKSKVDYAIPNGAVSRVHAEFGHDSDGYYVKDCNSANGTHINNGPKIESGCQYPIYDGDIIRIANVDLTFRN